MTGLSRSFSVEHVEVLRDTGYYEPARQLLRQRSDWKLLLDRGAGFSESHTGARWCRLWCRLTPRNDGIRGKESEQITRSVCELQEWHWNLFANSVA